jgi:outer membrane protein OmpA-like peptidoglycan-associated protein
MEGIEKENAMKKYMPLVLVVMFVSFYAVPVRADTGGAVPESPSSIKQPPTSGPAQSDMSGAPKLVVEFQSGHAEIPPSYSQNLKAFGKYLTDNAGRSAQIHGYADHTGHGPANAALAQKRADAVKGYLVTNCAVASSRITAEGYGEVSTKSQNSTEASKQINRAAIGTIIEPKS